MHHFNNLHELLIYELEDLLGAEQQLAAALPKMADAASDSDLKQALRDHRERTLEHHIPRLNRCFEHLGRAPTRRTCKGMEGIIKEGEEMARAGGDAATRDAAIIGAAQRAEHYEMAGYGTARAHANELGLDDVAELLQDTLDNEGKTNEKLTGIAEGGLLTKGVNPKAEAG